MLHNLLKIPVFFWVRFAKWGENQTSTHWKKQQLWSHPLSFIVGCVMVGGGTAVSMQKMSKHVDIYYRNMGTWGEKRSHQRSKPPLIESVLHIRKAGYTPTVFVCDFSPPEVSWQAASISCLSVPPSTQTGYWIFTLIIWIIQVRNRKITQGYTQILTQSQLLWQIKSTINKISPGNKSGREGKGVYKLVSS